jgi:hypothetical protein
MKWFFSLKSTDEEKYSLFDYYTNEIINSSFIVCQTYVDRTKEIYRYALFDTFVQFYKWYYSIPQNSYKSFYEVIIGKNSQKPYFDIDITRDDAHTLGPVVLNELLNSITKTITIDIEKDLCIYTSHNDKKFSIHIVINHWCYKNSIETKQFVLTVVDKLPKTVMNIDWDPKWVDTSVYKPTQLFRLLESTKLRKERYKKLLTSFNYNDEIIIHKNDIVGDNEYEDRLNQFEESLVTYTKGCKFLPSLYIEEDDNDTKYINNNIISDEVSNEITDESIISVLRNYFEGDHFSIRTVELPFIFLYRLSPTYCSCCMSTHEHENPYMIVKETLTTVSYLFYCRRNESNKYSVIYERMKTTIQSPVPSPTLIDNSPPLIESPSDSNNIFNVAIPSYQSEEDTMKLLMNSVPHDILKKRKNKMNPLKRKK